MILDRRQSLFVLLSLLPINGCAAIAVQTPSPARQIDTSGIVAEPGEQFYVIVFGSERTTRLPRFTHSWATFIRVSEQGLGREPSVEAHTISWVPATLDTRTLSLKTEEGANLNLHQSLCNAISTGQHVAQWGPYECRPSLYFRALVQKQFLESGQVGYQCIDTVGEAGRTGNGCDCIHAITDMDPLFSRTQYALIRYGIAASRFMVGELGRRDLINASRTHNWLNQRLGLHCYPISHRRYPAWHSLRLFPSRENESAR